MLPMEWDNVKRVTYKHRGKYGKKKKAVWFKKHRYLRNEILRETFLETVRMMNLMKNTPPFTGFDTRPINENIYKI